jgi:hypothetical protein
MTPVKHKKRFNRAGENAKKSEKNFAFFNFRVFVINEFLHEILRVKSRLDPFIDPFTPLYSVILTEPENWVMLCLNQNYTEISHETGGIMESINKQYIVDEQNNKIAVQIPIDTFEKIEEILENYALIQLMKEHEDEEVFGVSEAKSYYDQLEKAP